MNQAEDERTSARVAQLVEEARKLHPTLVVDAAQFAELLRARLAEETEGPLLAGDLYLAFACGKGAVGATELLDALAGPDVDKVNASQRSLGLSDLELRQLVFERVLVRTGEGPPRILSYSGRGPLRAWIRVAATRIALDLGRKKAGNLETPNDGALFDRLPGAQDPEMAYMRSLYLPELQAAFEAAFRTLTPRQRVVLRQRFAEQLGADAIAMIHGVHRATVFGWIEQAREGLIGEVRKELRARVRGTDETLDSVMALVARGLDISVGRLFGGEIDS